jgi:sugar phosphate isomerase/epimerase
MTPYTRRDFTKFALAAIPAAGLLSSSSRLFAADAPAKPNSKVNGVQIGLNVPYSFGNNLLSADDTLAKCVTLGISALELRSQPVELFLGVPPELLAPAVRNNPGAVPVEKSAVLSAAAKAEKLRAWRSSAPLARAQAFRAKYADAGVSVDILKFDNIYKFSDAELDYAFLLAKALGARAISCEISMTDQREAELTRLGSFADKHQLWVGYHGHTKVTPAIWEQAFKLAKFNGANVDIGHFIAGLHYSPVEFIKQYHDRITHIHIKDRKMHGPKGSKSEDEGPNVPFGEGDTPIAEVLRLLRDNKWPIQATIEFEYPVPAGSDRMTEIARSIKFCRDALA